MKSIKSILIAILLAQIALISWQWLAGDDSQIATKALVKFDEKAIDKLLVTDGKQSVSLQKTDNGWQLPELHNVAVNSSKLSQLIQQVNNWQVNWPVAETSSAQTRFEVAKDKFKRHVQVFAGNQIVADFYVGTSPGFRKSHVRLADSDNIYALQIADYDLPVAADQWMDKSLLAVNKLTGVQVADVSLAKTNEDWQLNGAALVKNETAKQVDQDKINDYINNWQGLTVNNISEQQIDKPDFTVQLTAENQNYTVKLQHKGDDYLIARNDIPLVFTIDEYSFKALTEVKIAQFYTEKTEQTETTENVVKQAVSGNNKP